MTDKKFSLKGKNILVTGGRGFVGKHVVSKLESKQPKKIFAPRSKEFDLRDSKICKKVVQGADIVIHMAANVGGIGYNREKPGELFYDNLVMGVHLMEEARIAGVSKFVSLGTICQYPKITSVPFKEDNLWNGYPEETNAPYGLAKKMLLVQSQAYRQQYGFNAIHLMLVNLYGPGDNFDPSSSHVIPALIKKFVDAKKRKDEFVVVWGTGNPTREFLYVEDAVAAYLLLAEKMDNKKFHGHAFNFSTENPINVIEVVNLISRIMKSELEPKILNTAKGEIPDQYLSSAKAKKLLVWQPVYNLQSGLKRTVDWYMDFFKKST